MVGSATRTLTYISETIEIMVNGNRYTAKRILKGTRTLSQHMEFRDERLDDPRVYEGLHIKCMKGFAEFILYQRVIGRAAGKSALEQQPPTPLFVR